MSERESLPFQICIGVITGVDPRIGNILSVRTSGGRTHTRVSSCVDGLSVGATVVLTKTMNHAQWVVIGQVSDGYNSGSGTGRAVLAPPANIAIFTTSGITVVEWETYPGDSTLSYEVQSAPDEDGEPNTDNITNELVTRGSYFIYENSAAEKTVHFRVRALRWISDNNLAYSGWCEWVKATSETGDHDLLGVRHRNTVPEASPMPGRMVVGNESNEWQSMDLSQDATVGGTGAVTVTGLQTRPLAATQPTDKQVVMWSGDDSQWEPGNALTNPMTEDLDMGGNDIIDVNEVDGVDISAHVGNVSNPHVVTAVQTAYTPGESVAEILNETINSGVLHDITITDDGGLDISWSACEVWDAVNDTEVDTDAGSDTCTDSVVNYLIWTAGSTLSLGTTKADPASNEIGVAEIACQAGDIWHIQKDDILHTRTYEMSEALGEMFPAIITTGLLISEDTDATNTWDVSLSAGAYYLNGHERHTIATPVLSRTTAMVRWYKVAGVWTSDTNAEIDNTKWLDGAALTAVTSNKYYRSNFFIVEGTIHWSYPDTEYNTIAQALEGG